MNVSDDVATGTVIAVADDFEEIESLLPGEELVGQRAVWKLPVDRGVPQVVEARFLGRGSSRDVIHDVHVGPFANYEQRERCNACRWFELRIFREISVDNRVTGSYIVHYAGRSIVPGERQLCRLTRIQTGFEVVEVLTTRRRGREPYLNIQAARALAQAAAHDDDLREAYVNRAVS